MKPTEKQIQIIEFIKEQVYFWKTTNDILSPTHYCDIEEEAFKLWGDDVLTDEEHKELVELSENLYQFIRNLK
jgi:hypothetical protein